MADDKKLTPKPVGWEFDTVEIIYILIILSAFFGTVVPAVMSYLTSGEVSFFGIKIGFIVEFFSNNAWIFRVLAFIIAGALAVFTYVFTKKGDEVWRDLRKGLYPKNMTVLDGKMVVPEVDPTKEKWKIIVEHSESNVESNWRLAIIEADIMLDELLDKLNLPGNTIGEKLKAVEPSDFRTLDSAWEAHKARNMVAHEGQGYLLNQRDTRRVISHYEAVFREFFLI